MGCIHSDHMGQCAPKKEPGPTGLSVRPGPHGDLPEVEEEPRSPLAWVSDELLAKTRQVWSQEIGRPVGVEEAVEILTNVKHLAQALYKAKKGKGLE